MGSFWVGYGIGLVIALCVGLVLLRVLPWRKHAETDFLVSLPVDEVQARLAATVAARRGWRTKRSDTAGRLLVRSRTNWATYAKSIEVSLEPSAEGGTRVVATSRSPQLVDWGDGRRALEYLRRSLTATHG